MWKVVWMMKIIFNAQLLKKTLIITNNLIWSTLTDILIKKPLSLTLFKLILNLIKIYVPKENTIIIIVNLLLEFMAMLLILTTQLVSYIIYKYIDLKIIFKFKYLDYYLKIKK